MSWSFCMWANEPITSALRCIARVHRAMSWRLARGMLWMCARAARWATARHSCIPLVRGERSRAGSWPRPCSWQPFSRAARFPLRISKAYVTRGLRATPSGPRSAGGRTSDMRRAAAWPVGREPKRPSALDCFRRVTCRSTSHSASRLSSCRGSCSPRHVRGSLPSSSWPKPKPSLPRAARRAVFSDVTLWLILPPHRRDAAPSALQRARCRQS